MSENISNIDRLLGAMKTLNAGADYYCLTIGADPKKTIWHSTQTEWIGWKDKKKSWELRQPRLINPQLMDNYWSKVEQQPYAVVNEPSELVIFMASGGNALIEESVARQHLPEFLEPDVCIPHGPMGFRSIQAFDKSALRKVPTPKLRMRVLNRDSRRCRVCGRRPDDHLDLELHVHHIRPWSTGGLTDIDNLITLCHTCHNGLEPHEDLSLFEYVFPKDCDIAIGQRYGMFISNVQNYRNIILEHILPDVLE